MSDKVRIFFIDSDGKERLIEACVGQSLMEAAVEHGIAGIQAVCGGCCACATCHVEVDLDWFQRVGPPSDMEVSTMYFGQPRRMGSRLACQIILSASHDGMSVRVVA